MVREDILGGLRTALARGQTLRQAMMSFYNAGYIKEEIEEAAKALQAEINQPVQFQSQTSVEQADIFQRTDSQENQPVQPQPAQQPTQLQTIQKVSAYGQPVQPLQQTIQPQPFQQPQTIQKVSAYGPPQQVQQPQLAAKPRGKAIIFILLALLILLIGGLIAVFFFKDELLAFFNSA